MRNPKRNKALRIAIDRKDSAQISEKSQILLEPVLGTRAKIQEPRRRVFPLAADSRDAVRRKVVEAVIDERVAIGPREVQQIGCFEGIRERIHTDVDLFGKVVVEADT